MMTFSDILDEERLRNLAGDRFFERGVRYFEDGLVYSLAQYDEHITAQVRGTSTYKVDFWLEDDDLSYYCTCPMGIEDYFCKHCVAVALAWIEEPPPDRPAQDDPNPEFAKSARERTTMEDVRDYLARQERDTLVRIIMDRAMEDDRWREQLLMKAASRQVGGANINTFRKALRNAIAVGDFVDYYGCASYAEDVQSAIDGLEDLLNEGYANDAIELSEEVIALLDNALNSIDGSNGEMSPIIEQVEDLHYRACLAVKPNPRALAERMFHMEMDSGFGFFSNALENYAEILGEEGQKAYGELIDAEWQKLPAIGPQQNFHYDYRRRKLNRMKETLVEMTGTLEELVAVISKDLSNPSRYAQIAQIYKHDGQIETAIDWAEKGMKEFQHSRGLRQLREFLINAYTEQGRFNLAIAIVWEDFEQNPDLSLYMSLKDQADKIQAWPTWRQRALDRARDPAEKLTFQQSYSASSARFGDVGYSLLVKIFLWEKDVDQAWVEAKAGGCSQRLWMELAEMRRLDCPEDALFVYRQAIEPLIEKTNNDAYQEAIQLLVKVKDLMARLNRQDEFKGFLNHLTITYKRKRNFIKFLKQERRI